MIGTIINSQFLTYRNYPVAAALAFIVMALMVVGATLYARLLGTEEITT
jgi:spermidine/putrescine transport system permease protein